MPDDEGYLFAGELGVGGYAALEGDLGEKLCGPLGFSAEVLDEEWDESFVPGFGTCAGQLRYVAPDQVESWGLFRWRTS